MLEWTAISASWGTSRPRGQTRVSCVGGQILSADSPGKPLHMAIILKKEKTELRVGRNLEKLLSGREWKRRGRWGKRRGGASKMKQRITA